MLIHADAVTRFCLSVWLAVELCRDCTWRCRPCRLPHPCQQLVDRMGNLAAEPGFCPTAPRLYAMGVITTKKSLVQLEKLSTASFCRRRLSVVMVRLKMAQTLREAVTFIEQVRPF